ncbi:MAG: N-acetyltransferase family protein [Gemmatimonadota bacterium]
MCPADRAALGGFFAGLSVTSRTLRFFAPVTPSQSMLSRLAGDAAGVEALVATCGGGIVGHAMAADQPGPPGRLLTHVGLVVADAWQGQGVGAALMRALTAAAACDRGVTSLAMDVLPENRRVLAMITAHWDKALSERMADCVAIRVPLPSQQHERPAA